MTLALYNRQRRVRVSLPWLRTAAERALPWCGDALTGARAPYAAEIEVSLVSDRAIAAVHFSFMGIADATDVITFQHGEIVVSADTACRCAHALGHPVEAELALYIIHGLLHLNGYDDHAPRDAARMRRVQTRLWARCLAEVPIP